MAGKASEKNAMSVINSHIASGEFSRIYLLTGNEEYLIKQYRDKLLEAVTDGLDANMNFMRFVGDKVDYTEVIGFCQDMPFFADYRVALVENTGFFKKSNEDFAKALADVPESSIIIFVENEIDRRNKMYTTVKKLGEPLEFTTPDKVMLGGWIRGLFKEAEITAADSAIINIIDTVGADMNTIKNEVEKLISFCADKGKVTEFDVAKVCTVNVEGRIFEMVDHIAKKRSKQALHLYHELLANREPAMRILYLIARQYDMLLKTKLCLEEGKSSGDIASVIGSPPWAVKKYVDQCRDYDKKELIRIMEKCQAMDYKLKSTQANDTVMVETLIIELAS